MARQIRKKSGTGIYHVIKERSALPLAPARTDPVIEGDASTKSGNGHENRHPYPGAPMTTLDILFFGLFLVCIPAGDLFSHAGGIEGREVRVFHILSVIILTRCLFHLQGNVRLHAAVDVLASLVEESRTR